MSYFLFGFPLSNDVLETGTYGTLPISLSTVTPQEGVGGYQAAVGATLFERGSYEPVTSSTLLVNFGPHTVPSPFKGNQATGTISMLTPEMNNTRDRGVLFAAHGGMIVNAINIGTSGGQIASGGTYTLSNLPLRIDRNAALRSFLRHRSPRLVDDVFCEGFCDTRVVDLRTGDDTANLIMLPLP